MNIKRGFKINAVALAIFLSNIFSSTAAAQEQQSLEDVQQIVAIVDDRLISVYDLRQRALLLMMSSGQKKITPEQQKYLMQQALRSLVDDKLKIEALFKRAKIRVSKEEKEHQFSTYAQQMRISPKQLNERLSKAGIKKKSILLQIEGSMAWDRLVGGIIVPSVNISDEEINSVLERIEKNKGQQEIHYREIFLLASDNAQREAMRQQALILVEGLRGKTSFQMAARQLSSNSTSAVGGDVGWIMKSEISKKLLPSLEKLKKGSISDPIVTEDGFYILQMVNTRKVLTADPLDTIVELKYLYFPADDASNKADMLSAKKKAEHAFTMISSCKDLTENKEKFGAEDAATLKKMRISDLSFDLHDMIYNLKVGHSTRPIKEDDGYRLFITCVKEAPTVQEVTYDTIERSLSNQRVSLIARRHLRDLRRDAIIDYR